MSKNDLQKLYNKKLILYKKYVKYYYEKNKSLVSDHNFDILKKELENLEKQNTYLKKKDSVLDNIGYKPSKNFLKSKHRVRMLSLSNIYDESDLVNFEKKICNFLDVHHNTDFEYSVEPKIDGISASLIYKNGILVSGLTRGDGETGELITENLKTITDIPKKVLDKNFPKDIEIRGEVFILNSDFKNLNSKFSNPRNTASGSLRQKDPNQTKKIPLRFIAYTYGFYENLNLNKQSEFLEKLKRWGFKVNKYNKVINGKDNLIKHHKEMENKRVQIDYDIDGLVYKINDFKLQNRLGYLSSSPRWATAHKFSAEKAISKIISIEIQIGRTGALTPVAKIEPVYIGGVKVSNVTLHNEEEILRKDIKLGDTVNIERAGDVIPHVISVDKTKRPSNSKKFEFPKKCPSCGSKILREFNNVTKKYDTVVRCSSRPYQCEKISIEKIKHFISKDAFNIDGFGKKVVEKFWKLNLIKYPQDIFKLDYKYISKLDGWGKTSTSNLKYSIEKSKKITLDKLIFSLGIRHIGQENAKLLSDYIKNLSNLLKINKNFKFNNFLNIDGIGTTQINSLKHFFSNETNLEVVNSLSKYIKLEILEKTKKGHLRDKSFLITGKINGMSRAEVKNLIEKNSGKILSSVNKNLNYLIVGDKPTTKKVNLAKELKIKLINFNELNNMLK